MAKRPGRRTSVIDGASPAPRPDASLQGGRRPAAPGGLSEEVAARLRAEGQGNTAATRTTRTVAEIVRANVLTRFNAILGVLLVVILVVGPLVDALFGIVLVSNTAIGIIQELRAKRTLDRLAVLAAPQTTVVRDGRPRSVGAEEVVLGDVVEVATGDQLPVDGTVLASERLEVDESLLSGESDALPKDEGDPVLSGSFVTAGRGWYRAERVGDDAYARRLADEARRFALVRSELRDGIDRILRWVTWVIAPVALLLVLSQLRAHQDVPGAVRGSVAGVAAMVPEGLVLLTSVAFAVSVVRLGRRRVLVQELAAVEGLARVDVICVDKTGTLTEPDLSVAAVEPLGDVDGATLDATLSALARSDPRPNASLRALASLADVEGGTTIVPFSSGRRWSAAEVSATTWVLGAADVLLTSSDADGPLATARAIIDRHTAEAHRVLLLARPHHAPAADEALPPLDPVALVALEERLRPDAARTVAYFLDQGVSVKVLSGDDPRTVGAVAARVGVPGADHPVDARQLSDDPAALASTLESATVFGRVQPHRKRAMVHALQAGGHVVAMTGDGVNDVLALKDADLGVAMGSGSPATRGVAQLVLLDSSWAPLPAVVSEGRRVIANVERVANLFVTKTVYALLLSVSVGLAGLPFPFLPRQLTLVSSLTIGVPAFFLALAPNSRRTGPGFAVRVLRFAVPAGLVAATATMVGYGVARVHPGVDLAEARTTATMVLFAVAAWVLSILARPLDGWRVVLVATMAAGFAAVATVPAARALFDLHLPPLIVLVAAAGVAAVANVILETGWRLSGWMAHRHANDAAVPARRRSAPG
jgi:cation-transporting P-type ATPase E